jgi:hypothetical protein
MAGQQEIQRALDKLSIRLNGAALTVWAVLKEDRYETFQGDGYYAYVEEVFLKPSAAAAAVEILEAEEGAGWYRRHIRRYELKQIDGALLIKPLPTEQEPSTIEVLAHSLEAAGLL